MSDKWLVCVCLLRLQRLRRRVTLPQLPASPVPAVACGSFCCRLPPAAQEDPIPLGHPLARNYTALVAQAAAAFHAAIPGSQVRPRGRMAASSLHFTSGELDRLWSQTAWTAAALQIRMYCCFLCLHR